MDNTPHFLAPFSGPNIGKKLSPKTFGENAGNSLSPKPYSGFSPNPQIFPPFRGGKYIVENFGEKNHPPKSPTAEVWGKLGEKGKKGRKKPLVTIIEDTREQTPLTEWPEGIAVERGTLHTGDYSIRGWENCFCIERKSLKDFADTMIDAYEANTQKPPKRFNRELERMRYFDRAAVIVTATPAEVLAYVHHCGKYAHGSLWGFSFSIYATYGIPVFFLTDEQTAARWIADLARHYLTARTKKHFAPRGKTAAAAESLAF